MSTTEIQSAKLKSVRMITSLASSAHGNSINILGSEYTITKIGTHYLEVLGINGGKYIVSTSPKCVVIEDRSCDVYFIQARSSRWSADFTLFDGFTTVLS